MQIFEGSWDQNSLSTHLFNETVLAQYVRIRPKEWHRGIGLRVELLGCPGMSLKIRREMYNMKHTNSNTC